MAVALPASVGVFFALSILIEVWIGVVYLAVFYLILMNYPWFHKAICRIAYGKEEKA